MASHLGSTKKWVIRAHSEGISWSLGAGRRAVSVDEMALVENMGFRVSETLVS
jgi:hypothetical protein